MSIVLGVDLGQAADYTAKAFIERSMVDTGEPHPERGQWQDEHFTIRKLERPPLKTPYPDIVRAIVEQMKSPVMKGAELVVDATGVGRPVIDLMRAEGLSPIPVTITGGMHITQNEKDGFWHVPKRIIVAALAVTLQTSRLHIVQSLEYAKTWQKEAMDLKVKITKANNDTYDTWRDGQHDDLVLATGIAVWWAERTSRADYRTTYRSQEEWLKEQRRMQFTQMRNRPYWHGPKG